MDLRRWWSNHLGTDSASPMDRLGGTEALAPSEERVFGAPGIGGAITVQSQTALPSEGQPGSESLPAASHPYAEYENYTKYPPARAVPEGPPAATETESPPLFSWEELAAWRWGPAKDDPTPDIIEQPDAYALAERVAIQAQEPGAAIAAIQEEDLDPDREAWLDARIAAQIANEPIPDPGVWRRMVATWCIAKRQIWADRAEEFQSEGLGWREAEWKSFELTAGEAGYPPNVRLRRVLPVPVPFPAFESLPGSEDLERARAWSRDFQCEELAETAPSLSQPSVSAQPRFVFTPNMSRSTYYERDPSSTGRTACDSGEAA